MAAEWSPRGALAAAPTVRESNGFTPSPMPDWLDQRVNGVILRGEARTIDRAGDGVAVIMGRLRVILSTATRDVDGHAWAHVSVARSDRMPTWTELVEVRDVLLGAEVEAYQVAAPRSRYVNRHERVLHLWADLAGPVLPAFESMASDGRLTI